MTQEDKKEVKMEDVKAKADEKKCPAQRSLVFINEFLSGPMCGKCFPCSFGSYEARIRVSRLLDGTATEKDIAAVRRIASIMAEASMCKKGKDTAKYISDHIDSDELKEHLSGKCPHNECVQYMKYLIIPEKCTRCGICLDVCRDNAIAGEKKRTFLSGYQPFEIVQKRCTKCGECIKVCPTDAIILVDAGVKEPAGV
ncbi:MAG: 4Fe-4S dicluster domain-containing protein [Nitrospiraceae bacterium]|nr:MAG: 4Fe-4S dicluster domain-containing protein [Nitrospiraceae bacterium]